MNSLILFRVDPLVERYCDECESFDGACGGGQQGECTAIKELLLENGCPGTYTVKGSTRADKCKFFSPDDEVVYAERIREQQQTPARIYGVVPGIHFPGSLGGAA